jgi:ferredoxin
MYFENYHIEKQAMDYYAELESGRKPLGCGSCAGHCESACPYGLKVRTRLLHSHEILTA